MATTMSLCSLQKKCFKFGLKRLGTYDDVSLKTGFHDYLKHFEQENCMPFKKQGAKAGLPSTNHFFTKQNFRFVTCKFSGDSMIPVIHFKSLIHVFFFILFFWTLQEHLCNKD